MIVLGIDPAIRTTGYSVVKTNSSRVTEIIDCGVIANAQKLPHTECLRRIYGGIEQLIELYHPDCAALEDPFVGKNSKTAIILGMARGAILAALANHNIPAYSYAPTTAKRTATGSGSSSKEDIAIILSSEFNINIEDIPLDSTDAVALALCHAQKALHPEYGLLGKTL